MKHTWLAFLFVALTLGAQTPETNLTNRVLTREDCIRLALENNLDIKIVRHGPDISRYMLDGAYGYYDPVFGLSASHDFSSSSGGFSRTTGLPALNSEVDSDSFNPDLKGYGPLGFNYDLFGDFSHLSGSRGGLPLDQYNSSAGIRMSQPLLKNFWIDQNRLNVEVNKKELKISQLALLQQIMDVAQNVEVSYSELISAREKVKVQEKAFELAQRLVEENRKKVQVGTLAPLDERQAESQAASAQADVLSARRQMAAQENTLRSLIGGNYAEWRKVRLLPAETLIAIPESYNLGESWRNAVEKRPDFLSARLEVEKQGLVVRFQANQMYPSLDLVGGYSRNGLSSTLPGGVVTNIVGTMTNVTTIPARQASFGASLDDIAKDRLPQYSAGIVLSFPLGNRAQRGALKGARAVKLQLEDRLRKKHEDIMLEVDNAVGEAQTQFERVTATREARRFAEEALDAEQKKLDNGKSTTFQVLGLQRELTARRGDEIDALAKYNEALTKLYFLEGTLLERNKVTVQFK